MLFRSPCAHRRIIAVDLVHVGYWCLLLGASPDPNINFARLAIWNATLGHELSYGSLHYSELAISRLVPLRMAGFAQLCLTRRDHLLDSLAQLCHPQGFANWDFARPRIGQSPRLLFSPKIAFLFFVLLISETHHDLRYPATHHCS